VSCLVLLAAACFAPSATAAPPANDNFANATVLGPGLPDEVQGTNAEATAEPGEPSHTGIPVNPAPQSSVWYRWTPTADVSAVIDTCDAVSTPPGITYDFAVYTGNSIATLGAPVKVGGGFTGSPGGCSVRLDATAGTTYSIAIDFKKSQGIANFTLRLRQLAPPGNDAYAAATVVGPTLPVSQPATTIDASPEAGEPAILGGSAARSVWFKWTAGASGQVRVDGCDFDLYDGSGNLALGVYTDTNETFPVGATIATSTECEVDFNAVSGTTYRIAFSGSAVGEGEFTFRIRATTPPANDNFANAIPVGPALPVSVPGINDFATEQASEPIHGGGSGSNDRSVWYTWTPTATEAGLVAFNACDNDLSDSFEPDLDVYTGSNLATLNPVGTAPGGQSPYCYKLYTAAAGTVYKIAVSSDDDVGDEGDFVLDIHRPQPPANDAFADAQTIGPTLPITVNGTTIDATEQDAAGEPTHKGFNDPLHSVWYRWTAPVSETVQIDTCGAAFLSALSVYTGSELNSLTRVAQGGEASCGFPDIGSRAALAATAGQEYLIAVDSFSPGYWGTFPLRINGPSGTPVIPPTTNPPSGGPSFDQSSAIKRCRKKFDKKSEKKKRKKCIRNAKRRASRG
jgi:hypothetical protein